MPRELITLQVGQCGNQIGWRFWDLALREHAKSAKAGMFDESMSTFFRNVDTRFSGGGRDIPLDGGRNPIKMLRARSVLIDTESGVLKQVVNGPLGELFDHHQFVTDVESSGAGNNWAHGHEVYGPKYEDAILSQVHQAVECCDSPQSFFTIHSLGGGTGSGLGTYIVALLKDEYPDIYRFNAAVFPSQLDDDVVTSPYNSVLALRELNEHCDCVLPIHNQALVDICGRIQASSEAPSGHKALRGSEISYVPPAVKARRTNARTGAASGASAGGDADAGAGAGAGAGSGSGSDAVDVVPHGRRKGSARSLDRRDSGSSVTDPRTDGRALEAADGRVKSSSQGRGPSGRGRGVRRARGGRVRGRGDIGVGAGSARRGRQSGSARGGGGGDAGDGGGGGGGTVAEPRRKPAVPKQARRKGDDGEGGGDREGTAFDAMNNIAAHLLVNLTSSMRFEGPLNVDLNEITTNLVPYPRLHYIVSSLSPLYALADRKARYQPRRLNQMFSDAFSPHHQLIKADPKRSTYLACGLLVRGAVQVSDVQRNIERMRPSLRMVHWNSEGFKVGLCSEPPLNQPYSLLCLANNCCIREVFSHMHERFAKLYRVRAHTFHYTEHMDPAFFDLANESLLGLIEDYNHMNQAVGVDDPLARLEPDF